MLAITANPLVFDVVLPAVAAGVVIGAALFWLVSRRQQNQLIQEIRDLEKRIANDELVRQEREAAFESANARLSQSFASLASRSLNQNSETFLRLAEQNLEARNERAKREFGEREKAVEDLIKPIRDALSASQAQINELEKARSEAYGGIRQQLASMQAGQQR